MTEVAFNGLWFSTTDISSFLEWLQSFFLKNVSFKPFISITSVKREKIFRALLLLYISSFCQFPHDIYGHVLCMLKPCNQIATPNLELCVEK